MYPGWPLPHDELNDIPFTQAAAALKGILDVKLR
jgi:hypothetical protein